MPKKLIVLNALLLVLAAGGAIYIVRQLTSPMPMLFTSPPAQKCPPRPVRMSTREVPSASISSSATTSSRRISRSIALRASGRFSVSVVIDPRRSMSSVW